VQRRRTLSSRTGRSHMRRGHVLFADRVLLGTPGLVAAAGTVSFAAFFSGWPVFTLLLTFAVFAVASALSAALILLTSNWTRTATCVSMRRAVVYLGSAGSCHSFEILSRTYAAKFVEANRHKLVNTSPQVMALLRQGEYGREQVARRLLRRR
jgi:hypothetical protein